MFKQMKNIDAAFRHIKTFSILLLTGCFFLCGYVLYKSYELSARVQDKIYILAGDKALEAYASGRKDNVPVEAKDHVTMFHQYFFTLDPDDKVIDANLTKALYLSDGSAKKQHRTTELHPALTGGFQSGEDALAPDFGFVLCDARQNVRHELPGGGA